MLEEAVREGKARDWCAGPTNYDVCEVKEEKYRGERNDNEGLEH